MPTATLSSRDFNQDISRAKRQAENGPVVITDRGRPAYVLLRYEEYARLTGNAPSIRSLLAQPGGDDFEFDPPKLDFSLFRPAELG